LGVHDDAFDPTQASFRCLVRRLPSGCVVVSVEGAVDILTGHVLQSVLDEQLSVDAQITAVQVDLTHTAFLSACGIGILLAAAHTAEHRQVSFRVTGCRPSILRVFDITGVTEALGVSR
jgi:anti-anti-sigma factor